MIYFTFYCSGDLAAEHLHYGGIACYSCRAFFRYETHWLCSVKVRTLLCLQNCHIYHHY